MSMSRLLQMPQMLAHLLVAEQLPLVADSR
jgi:hypothetical protein